MRADNPFDSEMARRHSRYFGTKDGRPILLSDPDQDPELFTSAVIGAFRGFVLNPTFVCVGAKAAVNHETYRLGVYDRLASPEATAGLSRDLYEFLHEIGSEDHEFTTFIATFREPTDLEEIEFEKQLWEHSRCCTTAMPLCTTGIRPSAVTRTTRTSRSASPATPASSSACTRAARGCARHFPWPTLVFNPHAQFERLREAGKFEKMKEVVRQREEELEGSVSPVSADFGADTEAKQYAGREVEPEWHPAFVPHPGEPIEAASADGPGPDTASEPPRCPFATEPPRPTRID